MGVVKFDNGLDGIHVRIAGPGRAGSMGAAPWSGVSDGLIVVLLFGDDGRGAPCELTLAHALQAGILADPTGQGRLWTYESRCTTLFNTSHPHHRQDSDLPTVEHISASIESSTVRGTSRFIERPERGLSAHGPVSGRLWVRDDVPRAHSTAGTPAAAAASLERPTPRRRRATGVSALGLRFSLEFRLALTTRVAHGVALGWGRLGCYR